MKLPIACATALLISSCASTPPPPVEPAQPQQPAPPDTAAQHAAALKKFNAQLSEADPDKAIVLEVVGDIGQDGAIALKVADAWHSQPKIVRQDAAVDLWQIWNGAWKLESGKDNAMVLLESRNGQGVGTVTKGGNVINMPD